MSEYTPKLKEHTCVVNIERKTGVQHWIMHDGNMVSPEARDSRCFAGTFVNGGKKVHVLIYGVMLSRDIIALMLAAWIGGRWEYMTVTPLKRSRKGIK